MRRSTILRILPMLLVAALCLPTAAAEARGYHVFGNVELHGAAKEGAVLHVQSRDGSVDLFTSYGELRPTESPHGTLALTDRFGEAGPGAPIEGWMSFHVEVPAGTYRLEITSGGRTFARILEVNGTAHETVDHPHGTYYLLDLGDVTLDVPGAVRPTPEPTPMPRPTPTPPGPGPTPVAKPTTPTQTATASPTPAEPSVAAPTPTPAAATPADEEVPRATPGPGAALPVAGLAAAAGAFRRRR